MYKDNTVEHLEDFPKEAMAELEPEEFQRWSDIYCSFYKLGKPRAECGRSVRTHRKELVPVGGHSH